jgi:hypothetical protein
MVLTGSARITGSHIVTGSITSFFGSAVEFDVQSTGVSMGSAITDVHRTTGSFNITGSLTLTGSATISGSNLTIFDSIVVRRSPTFSTKNIILNEDGNVALRWQSNDTVVFPQPLVVQGASTYWGATREWYERTVGSEFGYFNLEGECNGGTRHENLHLTTTALRSQNLRGVIHRYSGSVTIGNTECYVHYIEPNVVSGDANKLFSWYNTAGKIRFGNLSGTDDRLTFVTSTGELAVSSSIFATSGSITVSGSANRRVRIGAESNGSNYSGIEIGRGSDGAYTTQLVADGITILNSRNRFSVNVNGNEVIGCEENRTLTYNRTYNRQTGNYTLADSDRSRIVEMNVGSANNLTVPPFSGAGAVDFPSGSFIDVVQYGTGQTTIVAGSGVTLRSANGWLKINAQYGAVSLVKIGGNEWYVYGNLSA